MGKNRLAWHKKEAQKRTHTRAEIGDGAFLRLVAPSTMIYLARYEG